MPNSTTTLRSIVDYLCSLGELGGVLPASGYGVNTWLTMGTDVMAQLIAQRFNWKWNRMKIPPWYTISWQQDYAGLGSTYPSPIGWLESAYWIDINNTALPKPTYAIEVVRDLWPTSISGNPPCKIAWYPNKELVQGVWPGAGKVYTQPLGAVITPTNPITNILDANGNILVLTTYGTTGSTPPAASAASAEGTAVPDGSCTWKVADHNSQGFRIVPLPPQQGVVYQVNVVAQCQAPPPFLNLSQFIEPVPDDYAQWFRDGMYVWTHKMSPNPQARSSFMSMSGLWIKAMMDACKQGDRETDNAGFVPERSIMGPGGDWSVGPANPYGWGSTWWPGR
jgi:hypothetical protein